MPLGGPQGPRRVPRDPLGDQEPKFIVIFFPTFAARTGSHSSPFEALFPRCKCSGDHEATNLSHIGKDGLDLQAGHVFFFSS